jgi:hypothetical protein
MIGTNDVYSRDSYAMGIPTMNGLAANQPVSERIAHVRIGDVLRVERDEKGWVLLDNAGVLGRLRWRLSDDARVHPVNGSAIRLPSAGLLYVERIVVNPAGEVKDVSGYVTARRSSAPALPPDLPHR